MPTPPLKRKAIDINFKRNKYSCQCGKREGGLQHRFTRRIHCFIDLVSPARYRARGFEMGFQACFRNHTPIHLFYIKWMELLKQNYYKKNAIPPIIPVGRSRSDFFFASPTISSERFTGPVHTHTQPASHAKTGTARSKQSGYKHWTGAVK